MKTLTNVLILVALLMLVAICASAQVIPIHAPCTQTMYPAVGAYSGNLAIVQWERGVIVQDVTNAAKQSFSEGTWRATLGGCSGRSDLLWDARDYWQSVVSLTASNGTAKWLVTPGSPTQAVCTGTECNPVRTFPPGMGGLTYWKWSGTQYVVQGLLQPPSGKQVVVNSTAVLAGDTAWVQLTQNAGWVACDLNGGTCAWSSPQPSPPAGEGRQSGIGGHTYNVGIDYAHPPENGGPVWFWMARDDQPTPTRPPAPTNTKTPTGGVPRTPTMTATYNPCPPFCVTPGTPVPTTTRTPSRTATPTPAPARFTVSVTWTKPDGTSGQGVLGESAGTGAWYWFFDPTNPELFVAVLPSACAVNGNVWVKLFGGTNVYVMVTVTDRQTGASKTYTSPQGQLYQTVIDTAFEPCGGN